MAEEKRPLKAHEVREQNLAPLLETDFDVQALMVTPQSGRASIGQSLSDMYELETQEGDRSKRRRFKLWHLLSAVTSDERLANYRNEHQERYARWCMRFEGWLLDEGLAKPAATARWMRMAMVENGLGRNMALRNNLQEVRQKSEQLIVENKPEQKKILGGLFGGSK